MFLTFEDVARSGNEQMLSILTSWQQGSLEAFNAWMKTISPLVPDLNMYHELPTFMQDALGDPESILNNNYTFAIDVLNLQREWAHEIFKASMIAPRTPYVPRNL